MSTENTGAALIMANLCNIAGGKIQDISADVIAMYPSLTVVWGPFELIPLHAIQSTSLMYIVQGPILSTDGSNEYTVVIRGTRLDSWVSWTKEDFNIETTTLFSKYVNSSPPDAAIATGTAIGMDYLLQLPSSGGGENAVSFLNGKTAISNLNVVGHSLGGTLVPPFYTYLIDQLFGGKVPSVTVCQPFSFAGLTAGNAVFNTFFESFLPSDLSWRYVNTLDIAPNLWWSQSNVEGIYVPDQSPFRIALDYGWPEKEFFADQFTKGDPNNYVQPGGEVSLTGIFDEKVYDLIWTAQALHQHHCTTYISLLQGL